MDKKVRYFPLMQTASDTDSDVDIFSAQSDSCKSAKKSKIKKGIIISILLLIVIVCTTVSVTVHSNQSDTAHSNHRDVSDPVETECGRVTGIREVVHPGNKISYIFKGIPYAKPPIGNLRWRPSVRNDCWKGVYAAHTFGSECVQSGGGKEDCLYLNVVTPSLSNTSNLPVFVWIHGGYLMTGNGSSFGYSPDGEFVTSMNVVGVSMNYRLNAFGFLTLKELWDEKKSYGNYGFSDQILVLKWIQKNIKNFGGDPNSVTICGQSSGGTSIFGLLASPMADGLFHKVIPMSGSPNFEISYVDAAKDNTMFTKRSPCKNIPKDDLRSCFYNMTADEVTEAIPIGVYPYWDMEDLLDFPTKNHVGGALAVVDDIIVKVPPKDIYKLTFSTNVSVLIGNTAQEIGIEPGQRFKGQNAWSDFYFFLKKRTDAFSTDLIHNIWGKLYTNGTHIGPDSAQFMYETLTTDVRCTCPTNKFVKDVMRSPSHSVYRYILEYAPKEPGIELPIFSHPANHAFHALDAAALFGFKMFTQFGYKVTKKDLVLVKSIRESFLHFIKTGNLEVNQWKPGQTGVFKSNGKVYVQNGYHVERCKFWNDEKNGFVPYAFIN